MYAHTATHTLKKYHDPLNCRDVARRVLQTQYQPLFFPSASRKKERQHMALLCRLQSTKCSHIRDCFPIPTIDDILIYSPTLHEHLTHLELILKLLQT